TVLSTRLRKPGWKAKSAALVRARVTIVVTKIFRPPKAARTRAARASPYQAVRVKVRKTAAPTSAVPRKAARRHFFDKPPWKARAARRQSGAVRLCARRMYQVKKPVAAKRSR